MDARFKLHHIADIGLSGVPEQTYIGLSEAFPSFMSRDNTRESGPGALNITFVPELTLPAGARYMKSIAYDATSIYLLRGNEPMIRVDAPYAGDTREFQVSVHVDDALLGEFIETLLYAAASRSRMAFLHSGAIGVNGKAVVLAAWRRSGKSEAVIEFLRRGYQFMADDWVIISSDGTVYAYDKEIAMYSHDIASAPEVTRAEHGRIKGTILSSYARLRTPSTLGTARTGIKDRLARRVLGSAVRRMGMRTSMHIPGSRISGLETLDSAPLGIVYTLSRANVPEINIVAVDAEDSAIWAAANYRFESRAVLDPDQLKYAFPSEDFDMGLGVRSEDVHTALSEGFTRPSVKTFSVEIPVDTGPRQLVSALEAHMNDVLD